MTYSSAMPVEPFNTTFQSWADNTTLDLKLLRIKAITLLALSAMLRPSDIAPKGVFWDDVSHSEHQLLFTCDHVKPLPDGAIELSLFGIKNDRQRTGFQVVVQPHSNAKLCAVAALQTYMNRTQQFRSAANNGVFLALKAPHKPLAACGIAKDMEAAINLVGLSKCGFTAKNFRHTGATKAVEAGHNPEIVRKTGRWKSSEVFFQHYVHVKPPASFSEYIIG